MSAETAPAAPSRPWTPQRTPTVVQPDFPLPPPDGDTSSSLRCSSNRVKDVDVEDFSRRYGPMMLRRCRRLLTDENEALDACQDVFVRLLRHRERLDARYPSSLLYRIATNVCLNRLRDRRREPATREEAVLYNIARAEEPGAASDARMLLDRLFGRHPESTRTIAVLHFVDGLTLEEVADETGMSVSGVRKRLRKLRASLTEMIE
jgi:RNA polymerase sigma factor (sigma-70 family)